MRKLPTYAAALRWAAAELAQTAQGSLMAQLAGGERLAVCQKEAEELLTWAAGYSRLQLWTHGQETVPDRVWQRLQAAVRQRAAGQPLQYITGRAAFYGRTWQVRPGCLIPRPETEVLVERALAWLAKMPQACVLDWGTGSGVIALSVALAVPTTEVWGVDCSAAALAVARANAADCQVCVHWEEMDGVVWLSLAAAGERPRPALLLSNPPYIASGEIAHLASEVRDWEPHLALDGGQDGLAVYRVLAQRAAPAMEPNGPAALGLEVGAGQADLVLALFQAEPAWAGWRWTVWPDLRGIPRVVWGERQV
ncbi:MAG: peptide chain release factor N(5)-glutamine methyltransferase [Alicyclobacillus sp.]|nr:peptide chain release factor N(5)-glutamine methyltransferase [Alicyclobacillus sp.]